jgi:hypothetical protein
MALFDVPVHDGYKILTHTSTGRFSKNGLKQVGNELLPKNPINPQSVKASSIYNKNISGISEAGYGRAYPYYGLSRSDPGGWGLLSAYQGAGSPRASLRAYAGAGSPRTSLRAYAGAGSPRTSLRAYTGAGSPRGSVLRDAYINDNPPPGTLHSLSGVSRSGIPGRRTPATYLRGLADTETNVDTGLDYNMIPPSDSSGGPVESNAGSPSIWADVSSAFGSLFGTAAKTATQSGSIAIQKSIQGSINPPPSQPIHLPAALTTKAGILGMSSTTLLIVGAVGAYLYTRK